MAEFKKIYAAMLDDEGHYTLHNVKGDAGGYTFAGISKRYHPEWQGWPLVFAGKGRTPECRAKVYEFYKETYWGEMRGDEIKHQDVAETIFDFGMNKTVKASVQYAQYCLDCEPDGELGPITLEAINSLKGIEIELFVCKHALMRIGWRTKRIQVAPSQRKFAGGWYSRDLEIASKYINVNQYFGIR